MPIVPNFILKLEEQAQPPKVNIIEQASETVCVNRTISNDDQGSRPRNLDNKQYPDYVNSSSKQLTTTTQSPRECISKLNKTLLKKFEEERKQEEYSEYGDANVKAGVMFGSKALVQMLFNPFVGPITNR